MKKILFYALMAALVIPFVACNNDDDDHMHSGEDAAYTIQIMSPNTDDKKVGDMLDIEVEFGSENKETIHHVNVRIYSKTDDKEIYNAPDMAHIHESSGLYTFTDEVMLNGDTGVEGHTDWILEAKVWGHEAGKDEVVQRVEFHVHPN